MMLNTYGPLFDGLDQAAADRLDKVWAASEAEVLSAEALSVG
jgi:hypothetical protein